MRFLSLILIFLYSAVIAAEDEVRPIRFGFCTVCHGSAFQGNRSTDAPNLSILSSWYIEQQLTNYKNGIRGSLESDVHGREMMPMVSTLDENAIRQISIHIGKAEDQTATHEVSGNITAGAKIYQSCAACHGANGMGNKGLRAPRLAGQQSWYLERQLLAYTDGTRGVIGDDQSESQMKAAVSILSGSDAVTDVVAYLATLNQAQGQTIVH